MTTSTARDILAEIYARRYDKDALTYFMEGKSKADYVASHSQLHDKATLKQVVKQILNR